MISSTQHSVLSTQYSAFTTVKKACLLLAAIPVMGAIGVSTVQAQPIVPAPDGTNTVVTPNGNRIDITGGQTSGDRTNLFHSFTQFNVNQGQIANFLSSPEIRNILGRITGGDVSRIDGLIQVTGSNANLFLMNPAGIIFGSNASLNVPASFFATSANGIGFGNNWFNATGANNFAVLNGTPNSFAFTMSQPGSIINAGNLAVGTGQTLGLVGGTAINTGQLTAPSGQITVASVPGESMVQLSQPGFVLSLMIPPPTGSGNQPNQWTLPILSLPQLLTGGGGGSATGVTVNKAGQVVLTGSGIQVPGDTGTTIIAGTANASNAAPGQKGGTVHVLGEKVGLVGANINASGANGGGTVLIGGDYQGKGTVPNASGTFVSQDSVIAVDSFTVGNGGNAIVWADKATEFHGSISAKGGSNSGDGGFVEVSGKETLIFDGTVDTSAPNGKMGTLLLDPSTLTILDSLPGSGSQDTVLGANGQILSDDPDNENSLGKNTVTWGAIDSLGGAANVVLEATGDITIADVTGDSGGDITENDRVLLDLTTGSLRITSTGGNITFVDTNDEIRTEGGAITLQAQGGAIAAGRFNTTGAEGNQFGNVTLEAKGDLSVAQVFTGGGNISLTSSNGNIITGQINSFTGDRDGGSIDLTANGSITTDNVFSDGNNGGNITLKANNGSITTGRLEAFGFSGNGGAISLTATGDITTRVVESEEPLSPNIDSSASGGGTGGSITITSSGGSIDASAGIINSGSEGGNAGDITITASAPANKITAGDLFATGAPGTGNITLTADEIDLTGGRGFSEGETPGTTAGGGILRLQPATPTLDIVLGGPVETDTSALDLDTRDLADISNGFSQIIIGRDDGSGTISINNPVTFLDPVTIQAPTGSGAIAATADITGFDSITLIANQNITTSNITANGNNLTIASNNGNIDTTAGTLDTSGAEQDGGDINLTATNGTINAGVLNASGEFGGNGGNISLTAPNGNITLTGNINASGNETNGGTINFNGPVILASPITVTTGLTTGDINFSSTVNGTQQLNLTAGTTGTIRFNALVGGITPLGGLNITTAQNVEVAGGIITANSNIIFNSPVTLIGAAEFNAGTANIIFNRSLTAGSNAVTLTADGINLEGGDNSVTGGSTIVLQPATPGQNIAIGSPTSSGDSSLDLASSDITALADGFSAITIGRDNGSGAVTVVTDVPFQDPVTIRSPSGTITVNGQITGLDNASVTLTGPTTLNANITTAENNITINGNTALGTNVTLNTGSSGGGDILLNGGISGNRELLLNAGTGNVEFNGNIAQLSRLQVNAQNALLPSGDVTISTTNGDIIFNSNVTPRGNTVFDAGTATIALNSGLTAGSNSVTLTADEINLGGAIAGNSTLTLQPFTPSQAIAIGADTDSGTATLDLTNSDINTLQDGFSSITIGRNNSNGNITIPNDVTFNDPVTIQTPLESGAIAATGSITGLGDTSVTLRAYSNITANNITAPGGITLNSQTGTVTAGNLNASGTTQGGNITVIAQVQITTGQINSSASIGNGGNVDLDPIGDIQVEFINTQGGSRGRGGSVNVTTGRFFRALGTFTDQNGVLSSISTAGGTGGGGITIRHEGGPNTAFVVLQDPNNGNTVDNTQNGTRGNITAGIGPDETVTPGSYFGPFTQGLTRVITTPGNPNPPTEPVNPPTEPINPPTEPINPPTEPINPPTEPINPPTEPINPPTEPVNPPTEPINPPTEPINRPTEPVNPPTEPINRPTEPINPPTEPVNPPTEPVNPPTEPVNPPTEPVNPPTEPVNPPTEPINRPGGGDGAVQVPGETRLATDLQGETGSRTQVNNFGGTARVSFDTTEPLRDNIAQALQRGDIDKAVSLLEQLRQQEYANHFSGNLFQLQKTELSLEEVSEILGLISDRTGKKPAVIYVFTRAEQVDLILVTPRNKPVYRSVPAARRDALLKMVEAFRTSITDLTERNTDSYKAPAQQLYQWLIKPLEAELQARGINTIAFSMDPGLRSLPVAALYDGEKFLVEKYSLGLIPSMNLTDTRPGDFKTAKVLAMGASQFQEQTPLPAVPVELSTITKEWSGKGFLNEAFTLSNLKSQRSATPFGIIHLATHGEFKPGKPENSYIQLWNSQLKLTQLHQLGWNNPSVELLVLSACRTAVGDEQAELGFGGLAVASGAKTALASLWYVSDEGTLALMTKFYQQLKQAAIKADGLQQAQIAMLKGQVRLQSGQLQVLGLATGVNLPAELLELGDKTLEHPFYWAGFTMIGSPW